MEPFPPQDAGSLLLVIAMVGASGSQDAGSLLLVIAMVGASGSLRVTSGSSLDVHPDTVIDRLL
jgi:hypothetical protein